MALKEEMNSVQFRRSVMSDSATPWTAAHQTSLSIAASQSLLKLMSIESVMPSCYLILCCPLLLLPSIFPSIRIFSNESALRIRWPKYWSFSLSISLSDEYSGLISFRTDCLDLLAVQGTQEYSTPQFKSINSSALSFLYSPTLTSIHELVGHKQFSNLLKNNLVLPFQVCFSLIPLSCSSPNQSRAL
ncbi:unnamed protein product [Rangifer tarandus platyrhynchus]|uniref:Uncharacterized protein n=1 Tax=Rangifer tarandus platyrhynchus TaxID=3082113 RepID=A0AC59YM55_RANTA